MNWIVLLEKLLSSKSPSQPDGDSVIMESLDLIRLMRSAGGILSSQASLHGQLMLVEFEEEKNRLLQMVAMVVIGFVCGLCIMIFIGALVLAFSWDTPYRIHSLVALILAYGAGIGFALYRLKLLASRSDQAFIASRQELSADIALLRSRL